MTATRIGETVAYHGDCLDVMDTLIALGTQVDSIVTDPPYGLQFMGKEWDKLWRNKTDADQQYVEDNAGTLTSRARKLPDYAATDQRQMQVWHEEWARRALQLLKPGGYLLAFSGSRTYHRMACAIEDAGFEIRDQIMWLYSTGFPKSRDVAWDVHKMACIACGPMVEIDHGDEQTARILSQAEHRMRFVRATYLQTPVYACHECGQVLQPFLSEQESQTLRAVWSQSETIWPEQPGLEGRSHMETTEGQLQRCEVCTLSHGVFADGAQGRLRNGASSGDGATDWQVPNADGSRPSYRPRSIEQLHNQSDAFSIERYAQTVRGSGVNLKPAHEPVVMARKPLIGTVAANVLAHGTGAINIDACRVGTDTAGWGGAAAGGNTWNESNMGLGKDGAPRPVVGRFPANVLHDGSDEVLEAFGEAQRFFYSAKASKKDRAGSKHPTVKPVDLIRYLATLVTRPGGTVLDPFAGSGTLGSAWPRSILIEREAEYYEDILRRLNDAP